MWTSVGQALKGLIRRLLVRPLERFGIFAPEPVKLPDTDTENPWGPQDLRLGKTQNVHPPITTP